MEISWKFNQNLQRSPLPLLLAVAFLCAPSLSRPMVVDNPFLTIAIDRFVNADDADADVGTDFVLVLMQILVLIHRY